MNIFRTFFAATAMSFLSFFPVVVSAQVLPTNIAITTQFLQAGEYTIDFENPTVGYFQFNGASATINQDGTGEFERFVNSNRPCLRGKKAIVQKISSSGELIIEVKAALDVCKSFYMVLRKDSSKVITTEINLGDGDSYTLTSFSGTWKKK